MDLIKNPTSQNLLTHKKNQQYATHVYFQLYTACLLPTSQNLLPPEISSSVALCLTILVYMQSDHEQNNKRVCEEIQSPSCFVYNLVLVTISVGCKMSLGVLLQGLLEAKGIIG